jgi:hypothetical protein
MAQEPTRVLEYLHLIDGHFELERNYVPPIQREDDEYIMDILLASGKYSGKEICQLNYCRMYLQAVTISDIAET